MCLASFICNNSSVGGFNWKKTREKFHQQRKVTFAAWIQVRLFYFSLSFPLPLSLSAYIGSILYMRASCSRTAPPYNAAAAVIVKMQREWL